MFGWKQHSPVEGTSETFLYTLEDGFEKGAGYTEKKNLPFPVWVDPRPLFHLMSRDRFIIPIIYHAKEKGAEFLPFSEELRVDQSLFTPIEFKDMTEQERMDCLCILLNTSNSSLLSKSVEQFIETGDLLGKSTANHIHYFVSSKPILFWSNSVAEGLKVTSKIQFTGSINGLYIQNICSSPASNSEKNSDKLLFGDRVKSRYKDGHANTRFVDINNKTLIVTQSNFLPSRYPNHAGLFEIPKMGKSNEEQVQESLHSIDDGWLSWEYKLFADDVLIVGTEKARHSQSMIKKTMGTSISWIPNPYLFCPRSESWFYTHSNDIEGIEVPTWNSIDEPALLSISEYCFNGKIGDLEIKEDTTNFPGPTVEVCVPFSIYTGRTYQLTERSQVQNAHMLALKAGQLPVGYILPHPPIEETVSYEVLLEMNKAYGLSGLSRKDKSQLYRNIEESVHEIAQKTSKDWSLGEEAEARVSSIENSLGMILSEDANQYQETSALNNLRKSIRSQYTPQIIKTKWVGDMTYILNTPQPSANVSWGINLYMLGRLRGKVIYNPNTTPVLNLKRSTGALLGRIPTLPNNPTVKIELDSDMLKQAEELWTEKK